MKIINGLDLIKLPRGTIFQEYDHNSRGLGDLRILIEGMPYGDFYEQRVGAEPVSIDNLPPALRGKTPLTDIYPDGVVMPSRTGRDGLYDLEERWFLVYDEAGRQQLLAQILGDDDAERYVAFTKEASE